MNPDVELSRFITSSFPSVWALEVLLLLKAEADCLDQLELITRLRASELVISQALHALVAAGLVSVDRQGCASYIPASEATAQIVEATEKLYRRRPDAVRRMIVASHASGLTAFADAFRLRKD
jgi:DNA-binding transcriptional regulator PaaX